MQQQPMPPVAAGQAGQQYVGAVYAHGQYEWNAAQQKWEWKAKDNRALVAQQQQPRLCSAVDPAALDVPRACARARWALPPRPLRA